MLKTVLTSAAALTAFAGAALAAPEEYTIDTSHAQIVFSYDHLGFSTTTGMFGDITGTITFDAEDPAASSVNATFPVASLLTGFQGRDEHFASPDFFGAEGAAPEVTFVSTGIEVTGENTALITGDLTLNGVTQEVVLDTVLNQQGTHPMEQKPWLGFDATTTLTRSEWNLGMFAPAVSDEVEVSISIEAMQAD
ncbi:YceI family protein [Paracoccus tibetensis]|uniref:Polyisoprenoid-binding protein YceI n=1 Tax=Paracoccus tibetensis TaxID=336292 RepID=A0A1G5BCM7_9RHOB|nr:YceI family protein [Paracoccus tibetensis]SCX87871.1 Polyisoprenoid-binding protein YceI [Paracoccus tibetensis]